jgi:hypothetical protein
MSHSTTHPPKTAFHGGSYEPGYVSVTFYCPVCHHWLAQQFKEEYAPETGAISDGWHVMCRLINTHNPLRCNGIHDIIPIGPKPQALRDWFDADKPDWPKCPEDFIGEAVK